MRHKIFLFSLAGLSPVPLWAQTDTQLPEVVVTSTRSPTPVDQITQSVTVITRAELEQRGITQLDQALREVPGLALASQGPFGGTTSVFLRGMGSGGTLVLLDGVPLNDPSSINKSFDFAAFDLAGIERIEVLRGPASTLYGSEALGGVINLISAQPKPGLHGSVAADYGTYDTFESRARIGGGNDLVSFNLEGGHLESDGVNKRNQYPESLEPRPGDMGYRNNTLAGQANIHLASAQLKLHGRTEATWLEYDAFGTPDVTRQDRKELGTGLTLPLGQQWTGNLDAGWTETRRSYSFGDFQGDQYRYSAKAVGRLAMTQLTIGYDHDRENAQSSSAFDAQATHDAAYVLSLWNFDPFHFTTGARYTDHSRFGSKATYQLGASYSLTRQTVLKANYATAFKAPTLFQLYDPFSGNQNLRPERTTGWDLGLEQGLGTDLRLAVSYFRQRSSDAIGFDPATFQSINVSARSVRGIESSLRWHASEQLDMRAGYTHTNGEEILLNGTPVDFLQRIPEDQYFLHANYNPLRALRLDAELNYVGSRRDLFFGPDSTTTTVNTGNYALVNLAARYTLPRGLEAYARVDNLLDRKYQEVAGYTGMPRFVQAGLRMGF